MTYKHKAGLQVLLLAALVLTLFFSLAQPATPRASSMAIPSRRG